MWSYWRLEAEWLNFVFSSVVPRPLNLSLNDHWPNCPQDTIPSFMLGAAGLHTLKCYEQHYRSSLPAAQLLHSADCSVLNEYLCMQVQGCEDYVCIHKVLCSLVQAAKRASITLGVLGGAASLWLTSCHSHSEVPFIFMEKRRTTKAKHWNSASFLHRTQTSPGVVITICQCSNISLHIIIMTSSQDKLDK